MQLLAVDVDVGGSRFERWDAIVDGGCVTALLIFLVVGRVIIGWVVGINMCCVWVSGDLVCTCMLCVCASEDIDQSVKRKKYRSYRIGGVLGEYCVRTEMSQVAHR